MSDIFGEWYIWCLMMAIAPCSLELTIYGTRTSNEEQQLPIQKYWSMTYYLLVLLIISKRFNRLPEKGYCAQARSRRYASASYGHGKGWGNISSRLHVVGWYVLGLSPLNSAWGTSLKQEKLHYRDAQTNMVHMGWGGFRNTFNAYRISGDRQDLNIGMTMSIIGGSMWSVVCLVARCFLMSLQPAEFALSTLSKHGRGMDVTKFEKLTAHPSVPIRKAQFIAPQIPDVILSRRMSCSWGIRGRTEP